MRRSARWMPPPAPQISRAFAISVVSAARPENDDETLTSKFRLSDQRVQETIHCSFIQQASPVSSLASRARKKRLRRKISLLCRMNMPRANGASTLWIHQAHAARLGRYRNVSSTRAVGQRLAPDSAIRVEIRPTARDLSHTNVIAALLRVGICALAKTRVRMLTA